MASDATKEQSDTTVWTTQEEQEVISSPSNVCIQLTKLNPHECIVFLPEQEDTEYHTLSTDPYKTQHN